LFHYDTASLFSLRIISRLQSSVEHLHAFEFTFNLVAFLQSSVQFYSYPSGRLQLLLLLVEQVLLQVRYLTCNLAYRIWRRRTLERKSAPICIHINHGAFHLQRRSECLSDLVGPCKFISCRDAFCDHGREESFDAWSLDQGRWIVIRLVAVAHLHVETVTRFLGEFPHIYSIYKPILTVDQTGVTVVRLHLCTLIHNLITGIVLTAGLRFVFRGLRRAKRSHRLVLTRPMLYFAVIKHLLF